MRTRTLGGSLLIMKGLNDCVTIERNNQSKAVVVRVEGPWSIAELKEAMALWQGSPASKR